MEPTMVFDHEKLRELRQARGMSLNTLAIAAGIKAGPSHIGKWETGGAPNGRNLLALARALGVSPDDLYRTEDE